MSIRFRENDRVCGIANDALRVSVYSNPRFGEGRLIGDSIVVYTPGPEFSGYDEMVYKLTTSSGEITAYGIITFTDKPKIQILKRPPGSSIFFIDEKTGFVAGSGIYKTTDGGISWSRVLQRPDTYGQFTEIQFIDSNNGFAGYYSECPLPGDCDSGYFVRTTDGGSTWKLSRLEVGITSVFFTSPMTGFMGYNDGIMKTEDGGVNWKVVLLGGSGYGTMRVRFADSTTGYSYQYNRMHLTTDAGNTWKLHEREESIVSLAIIPKNSLFAIFEIVDEFTSIVPSSINTSVDGINWKSVANFPYQTSALAFSPTGEIGFALGVASPPLVNDPLSFSLSIVESADGGASWQPSDIEEHLLGRPLGIAVPSNEVAYFLCSDKLIKYTIK